MKLALGKRAVKKDERTLQLAPFLRLSSRPEIHDWDMQHPNVKIKAWANDSWGNCVKVAQAHQTYRSERDERKIAMRISDLDVIYEYQQECDRQFGGHPVAAGDPNDRGLVMLDNLRNWRKIGWSPDVHQYNISMFGELNPRNIEQLKLAMYLLGGVHIGLNLPLAAAEMLDRRTIWSASMPTESSKEPGSWGGHCVFAKRYKGGMIELLSWGRKILATDEFIYTYADEAYAVVDQQDKWVISGQMDWLGMQNHLREVGAWMPEEL